MLNMLRQLQFSANLFHVSTINVVENGSFINNVIYTNITPEHCMFVFLLFSYDTFWLFQSTIIRYRIQVQKWKSIVLKNPPRHDKPHKIQ